jgi:hypothetical protein
VWGAERRRAVAKEELVGHEELDTADVVKLKKVGEEVPSTRRQVRGGSTRTQSTDHKKRRSGQRTRLKFSLKHAQTWLDLVCSRPSSSWRSSLDIALLVGASLRRVVAVAAHTLIAVNLDVVVHGDKGALERYIA